MTFRNILENTLSGDSPREEYSGEKAWNTIISSPKFKKNPKKALDGYQYHKIKDVYYLVKDDIYHAHLDCTHNTIESGYSVFEDVAYSKTRGAYKILLLTILKISKIKNIISDNNLSVDAHKFWVKLNSDTTLIKSFFDSSDKLVIQSNKFSTTELKKYLNSGDYRIALSV